MNLAIYKYAIVKYLKSYSTWIILAFSLVISGFLATWLPLNLMKLGNGSFDLKTYSIISIAIIGSVTSFCAVFTSVFAAFKGATMFKDEVEDGSFLITLSKPTTRGKIIFQKWLALQTVMLMYAFVTILVFVISILVNDRGDEVPILKSFGISSLTNELSTVAPVMFAILIIIGMIFSSLALLISTRASVATTIGIVAALGVVIPISGTISYFTAKTEVQEMKDPEFARWQTMDKALGMINFDQVINGVLDDHADDMKTMGFELTKEQKAEIVKQGVTATSIATKSLDGYFDRVKEPWSIYNWGVKTGEKDDFDSAQYFDLNYQVRQMSNLATFKIVPESLMSTLQQSSGAKLAGILTKVSAEHISPTEERKGLDQILEESTKYAANIRDAMIEFYQKIIDTYIQVKNLQKPIGSKPLDPISLSMPLDYQSLDEYQVGDRINKITLIKFFLDTVDTPKEWMDEKAYPEYSPLIKLLDSFRSNTYFNTLIRFQKWEYKKVLSGIMDQSRFEHLSTFNDQWYQDHRAGYEDDYKNIMVGLKPRITDLKTGDPALKIKDRNGFHIIDDDKYKFTYVKNADGTVNEQASITQMMKSREIDDYDLQLYKKVRYLIDKHPEYFSKIKIGEYSDPLTLLLIYLGIALLLMPISYLIIRKRDYR